MAANILILLCMYIAKLLQPVVVLAQVLVSVIQGHSLSAEVETQERGRCWGILPEDHGAQLCLVRLAVGEVCGIVGALSTFGAAVIMFFWVYAGQIGVEM